jgi:hypothetical protein
VDEVVGGFQIAGDGSVISQDFQVSSANWGPVSPLKVYKHSAPITDCRTGTCYKAYDWFNGYLSPSVINAATKGVSGLPSSYVAYQTPINPSNGTNNVNITNAATSKSVASNVAFSPGPQAVNPFYHSFLNGPNNWTSDLSIFKVFPITETVNLRFNVDAFNAFNVQGFTNPSGTDGTEQFVAGIGQASSYWTPRQLQFTLRLSF